MDGEITQQSKPLLRNNAHPSGDGRWLRNCPKWAGFESEVEIDGENVQRFRGAHAVSSHFKHFFHQYRLWPFHDNCLYIAAIKPTETEGVRTDDASAVQPPKAEAVEMAAAAADAANV